MPINFNTIIRSDIDQIILDTHVSATFHLSTQTAVRDSYGRPIKSTLDITTDIIVSPIKNNDKWEGIGVNETSDLMALVHRLESGGVDYINSEYFSRTNIRLITVTIGTRNHKVVSKHGHDGLTTITPYIILELERIMDVTP